LFFVVANLFFLVENHIWHGYKGWPTTTVPFLLILKTN
jgi:hypothetical protein